MFRSNQLTLYDVWVCDRGLTNKVQQQLQLAACSFVSLEAEDIMIWPSTHLKSAVEAPVVAFQHCNRFLHIPPDFWFPARMGVWEAQVLFFRVDRGGHPSAIKHDNGKCTIYQ